MNVYEIEYQYGYSNNQKTYNVLAKDAREAIEFTLRHAKKNYHTDARITGLSMVKKIDIYYKTKSSK